MPESGEDKQLKQVAMNGKEFAKKLYLDFNTRLGWKSPCFSIKAYQDNFVVVNRIAPCTSKY